jgi:hypothetical protein
MQTEDTDVLVVGAGTGGVAAAIAAARAGATVILVEQEPIVGGTVTGSYVTMPCGGPRNGLYEQMLERLRTHYRLLAGPRWFLPSSWLAVMNEMLVESGVRAICGVPVGAPIIEDAGGYSRVAGAILPLQNAGEMQIRAAVTIDATGTGVFAEAAGCEARYGSEAKSDFDEPHAPAVQSDFVQHCTWMYISQKLGTGPAFDMTRLAARGVLEASLGWFHKNREESLRRDAGIYLHWGSAVPCRDTRDSLAIAEAQETARRNMQPDMDLLRENGYAVHLAPRLGVREVRRIVGEYMVSECDLRSGKLPDDTIAIGTYGLDIWGGNLTQEETHMPAYGIPYRALVPKGVDGLLLAGKSISGTHIAMSAYRVQPILATYSQAAGVAAAWCASNDARPRDADVPALRASLTRPEQGVVLEVD